MYFLTFLIHGSYVDVLDIQYVEYIVQVFRNLACVYVCVHRLVFNIIR